MTRFFKGFTLLLAIACFVWVGVLWRWQATQRDMSVEDIGLYLVALPLALFGLLLLGRWAWNDAATKQSEREARREREAAAAAAAPVAAAVPRRAAPAQVLAVQARCAAGDTPAQVLEAMAKGQPRADLDPELCGADGLPLVTARIRDLDVEALGLDELEAATRPRQAAWRDERSGPEMQRALAALAPVLEGALQALAPWRSRFGLDDAPPRKVSTSMLRVLPTWPSTWSAYEQAVAAAWLQRGIEQAAIAAPARVAFVKAPASPHETWPLAEALLDRLERESRHDALLLVACHSALSTACVQRLHAAGAIFGAATPRAPVAGEAAAALVLAPLSWPSADAPDAPVPPRLHRAGLALRDTPIDARGAHGDEAARACIAAALASGPWQAQTIAAVLHDADQHTARANEVLAAVHTTHAHLQADTDVLGSGPLNGQTGAAATLLTVALAAQHAQQLDKPCLALSLDDARLRLAWVVAPASVAPEPGPLPASPPAPPA